MQERDEAKHRGLLHCFVAHIAGPNVFVCKEVLKPMKTGAYGFAVLRTVTQHKRKLQLALKNAFEVERESFCSLIS